VSALADELAAAGGAAAPASATARLKEMLGASLRDGRAELAKPRSGYDRRVEVGIAARDGLLLAVTPATATLRADPEATREREWLLVAATVAALADLACLPKGLPELTAGEHAGGFLLLAVPAPGIEAPELEELAPLAFEERAKPIDRLRARALALPPALLEPGGLKAPIGAGHPLRIAETIARLGGRPEDPKSVEEHEEEVLAQLEPAGGGPKRPHEDPDPARRVARRILQRLDGMGKWGGYHTDFAHLARGFAGNDRALAQEMGEALLAEGLLAEKPSVGQRHVFLNPRRAGDIRAFIERGDAPPGLRLDAR
jgi:hypothetical protein